VLANPQSQAFRDYLDRLYLHTTRLAALISEIPAREPRPLPAASE
jgi:hypothetical protein